MNFPATSVIVCTRNRPGFAEGVIASMLGGVKVPAEIVVIDQSDIPDPGLAANLNAQGCAVVHRPSRTRGLSAARNEGVAVARNELLVFVDDDMIAPPTWFLALVSTLLERGRRTVVTGQVRPGEPEVPGGFAPSLITAAQPIVYAGRVGDDILYPNNMALFRSAVDEVGAFDERLGAGTKRFPGAEDNDFCYRLLEAGYEIIYEPRALLYHRAWRSPTNYVRHRWQYGRGQGGFHGKHVGLRDRHILWRLVRDSGSLGWRTVRDAPRRPRVAVGHMAFLAGMLSAFARWTMTERRAER
jgi:O-antigen biosynthesis protein